MSVESSVTKSGKIVRFNQKQLHTRWHGTEYPLYLYNQRNAQRYLPDEVEVGYPVTPDPSVPEVVDVRLRLKGTSTQWTIRYNRLPLFAVAGQYFDKLRYIRYGEFSSTLEIITYLNSQSESGVYIDPDEIVDEPIRWDSNTPGYVRVRIKPDSWKYHGYFDFPLLRLGGLPKRMDQQLEDAVEYSPDPKWYLQASTSERIHRVFDSGVGRLEVAKPTVVWTLSNTQTDPYTVTYTLEWVYSNTYYSVEEPVNYSQLKLYKYHLPAMQTEFLTYTGTFPLTLAKVVDWLADRGVRFEPTDLAGFFLTTGRQAELIQAQLPTVSTTNMISFRTPINVQLESEATTLVLVVSDRSERFSKGSYYVLELR